MKKMGIPFLLIVVLASCAESETINNRSPKGPRPDKNVATSQDANQSTVKTSQNSNGDSLSAMSCGIIPHERTEVRTRFAASSAPFRSVCDTEEQTRNCVNGSFDEWSGTFDKESCTVAAPANCDNVQHNGIETRLAFESATVPNQHQCKSEMQTRICDNGQFGSWSGSFTQIACTVQGAPSCGSVPHNGTESRLRYSAASVPYGQTCQSDTQTRTCLNGSFTNWSGSGFETCTVTGPANCNGLVHGASENRIRYQSASVPFGNTCFSQSQSRSCSNGALSNWSGDFTEGTCFVEGYTPTLRYNLEPKIKPGSKVIADSVTFLSALDVNTNILTDTYYDQSNTIISSPVSFNNVVLLNQIPSTVYHTVVVKPGGAKCFLEISRPMNVYGLPSNSSIKAISSSDSNRDFYSFKVVNLEGVFGEGKILVSCEGIDAQVITSERSFASNQANLFVTNRVTGVITSSKSINQYISAASGTTFDIEAKPEVNLPSGTVCSLNVFGLNGDTKQIVEKVLPFKTSLLLNYDNSPFDSHQFQFQLTCSSDGRDMITKPFVTVHITRPGPFIFPTCVVPPRLIGKIKYKGTGSNANLPAMSLQNIVETGSNLVGSYADGRTEVYNISSNTNFYLPGVGACLGITHFTPKFTIPSEAIEVEFKNLCLAHDCR